MVVKPSAARETWNFFFRLSLFSCFVCYKNCSIHYIMCYSFPFFFCHFVCTVLLSETGNSRSFVGDFSCVCCLFFISLWLCAFFIGIISRGRRDQLCRWIYIYMQKWSYFLEIIMSWHKRHAVSRCWHLCSSVLLIYFHTIWSGWMAVCPLYMYA